MNKKLFPFVFFLLVQLSFAQEFTVAGKNYTATFDFTETSHPGEAFFVNMHAEFRGKKQPEISAQAELVSEKTVAKTDFYYTSRDGKSVSMLTILPMWSWVKPNPNSKIIVTMTVDGEEKSLALPVSIEPREYPNERLHLNEGLSDLVSTPSPEKKEQSRVLNELLQTVNKDSVYELNGFIRPMSSTRITSLFGQSRTLIYNNGKEVPSYHAGIDFGIPTGTEIHACGAGKVVMARWRIITGYSVIIEHLPGLYSIYYHLSELKCAEGDIVKKGDTVALSGATGFATGPHLHWEIRLNSVCLDPDSFAKDFSFGE